MYDTPCPTPGASLEKMSLVYTGGVGRSRRCVPRRVARLALRVRKFPLCRKEFTSSRMRKTEDGPWQGPQRNVLILSLSKDHFRGVTRCSLR